MTNKNNKVMKANEAPERLYLSKTIYSTYLYQVPDPDDETAIEYTRTDAFIEKALKWYCLDCECNDNCKDTKCYFYRQYERYLKGEENSIPPKFSDRILNEDGSTSDNYRYRHFISRMQDAFIEKAAKWVKERAELFLLKTPMFDYYDYKKAVEDFRKYMKGE